MTEQHAPTVAPIPPLEFQNYPIDVIIRIHSKGSRYRADVNAIGQSLRVPIDVSAHDLAALNGQLQETLGDVARAHSKKPKPGANEQENHLHRLAEQGHFAFRRIFGHRDALETIQGLLNLSDRFSIQIASDEFSLPWELIYPRGLGEPLSYEHFWGFKHILSRTVTQEAGQGAFVPPEIRVAGGPRLGLLAYDRLNAVRDVEIPFFEDLNKEGRIALRRLGALDPAQKRAGLATLRGFWQDAFDLTHLACHAFYESDTPSQSSLLLSGEFSVTLMDIENYDIRIAGQPLVILNACETGVANPLYTSDFAGAFLKYGARGVVATGCPVPDKFAAAFAKRLYAHLLAGHPLGESLLAIRRHFLEQDDNPAGLLYAMYAPPTVRLAIEGEQR
jgi:hypothetical protein